MDVKGTNVLELIAHRFQILQGAIMHNVNALVVFDVDFLRLFVELDEVDSVD